ncbi:MAG: metallophosphoesterase [Thermoplasmata archaeon]
MIDTTEELQTPEEIARMKPEDADALLDRLEARVPVHPTLLPIPSGEGEALVFGDTHGDLPSVQAVLEEWHRAEEYRLLIGLGDYVDRTPPDVPNGSVLNALYLLQWAARFPERVILLSGNHELARQIPVVPSDLPAEIDDLWGPGIERQLRITHLLERGPLAAYTESGVYLAHAGFPRHRPRGDWTKAFETPTEETLAEVVWADCGASQNRRRVVRSFTEGDLDRFLSEAGLIGFLRGHDPDLTGRRVFHDRCLTLHTTRYFADYGGVLAARVPLRGRLTSLAGVSLVRLEPAPPATA